MSLAYIQVAYKLLTYDIILCIFAYTHILYMCTGTEKHNRNWMHNIDVHFISVVLSHTHCIIFEVSKWKVTSTNLWLSQHSTTYVYTVCTHAYVCRHMAGTVRSVYSQEGSEE